MPPDDPPQLPLALDHAPQYGRADFIVGPSNAAALRLIESWPHWPAPVALLSGPTGSGKTHLAHIWAARSGATIIAAEELSMRRTLANADGIRFAVEAVDAAAMPEDALFHLVNSAIEQNGSLLLVSRSAADRWQPDLPDLRSRLRLATPVMLGAPDDDLLRKVLVKLFADRQLIIEKNVIDYVLLRMERSLSAAAELVADLDRQALAAGRRITRPMAASLLAGGDAASAPFAD